MPEDLPARIILFDSQCNLCNGWTRFILKRDKNATFALCRVQSPAGQRLLAQLGLPLATYETMIYLERRGGDFAEYHRSEAALRVVAQLPAPWRQLALLRLVPRGLRDWLYDVVARNRYRLFGRPPQCRLPSVRERHRFLEEIDAD